MNKDFELYTAPKNCEDTKKLKIFLAGSIDQGSAVEWQKTIITALEDFPVVVFNPRRDVWDASWEQDVSNPQFAEQVNWELEHIEYADLVLFYFDSQGKSPITLLELGLCSQNKDVIVCCPKGYWRRGNVQVVCEKFEHLLCDSLELLINHAQIYLGYENRRIHK